MIGKRKRIRRLGALWLLLGVGLLAPTRPAAGGEGGATGTRPRRLPGVAFLLSAVLPGAGQLYNGDHRGFLYLAADVSAWFAHASYQSAANTERSNSQKFAALHWYYDIYASTGAGADSARSFPNPDANTIVTPTNKANIQDDVVNDLNSFYQAIGTDPYRSGWDDFAPNYDPNSASPSANRQRYLQMRSRSDNLRSNARLAAVVLVLDRIVSGLDAFETARGRFQPSAHALHLDSRLEGSLRTPRAVLQLHWSLP